MRNTPLLLPAPRILNLLDPKAAPAPLAPALNRPQAYLIHIDARGTHVTSHDPAGLFYAKQTLAQLRRQFGDNIPFLHIEDWPDFPARGVMLDISRDKVPTMQTLFALVDELAHWKINQLQLYTEHTFAYAGHEDIWRGASPITPDEVRQLDAWCKARFIELVPNQNSFGHMERWLKHPRYTPLAEAPNGSQTPWNYRWEGPFSLCPTDPASLELLRDLYNQFLPNFSSPLFNVGCDETFDVGQGRSKSECERLGVHVVYLNFLKKVHALAASHGRRMMFWGDIILHQPDLIPQLPKDVIAMNWGYEATHPFEKEAALFKQSGIDFFVCPGTSSWCSIAGRTDNMIANQFAAARAGLRHGAIGYLNTDWGDHGHLQYLPISYPGFAAGAALSWCTQSNENLPLADVLNLHVFRDSANIIGPLALALGNVYQSIGKLIGNRSALFSFFVPSSSRSNPTEGITLENIAATESAINAAITPLGRAQMNRPDAQLIQEEFRTAADMLLHACRKAAWLLTTPRPSASALSAELEQLISTHRRLWPQRNRPGGLDDSAARLAENLPLYGAART
jgi:hexosaminidase